LGHCGGGEPGNARHGGCNDGVHAVEVRGCGGADRSVDAERVGEPESAVHPRFDSEGVGVRGIVTHAEPEGVVHSCIEGLRLNPRWCRTSAVWELISDREQVADTPVEGDRTLGDCGGDRVVGLGGGSVESACSGLDGLAGRFRVAADSADRAGRAGNNVVPSGRYRSPTASPERSLL
jgi:hypothetical protein